MNKYINKKLIEKSLYNINLLIKNNKNEKTVQHIKNYLITYNKITYSEYYYINKNIDKIYISNSIKEGLECLRKKNIDTKVYQDKYILYHHDNIKLYYLFKEIENEVKKEYTFRLTYNLLPFYYNIYLNRMK
jgi:hypothetical protein